jgi:hypothetical protein
MDKLRWGQADLVPDDARAAWGCRAIATSSGAHDMVWDRTDCVGSDEARAELLAMLNDGRPMSWEDLSMMSRRYDDDEVGMAYTDYEVSVRTRSAGGYCYVTIWLHDDDPTRMVDCPVCGGEGALDIDDRCLTCAGKGTVPLERAKEVVAEFTELRNRRIESGVLADG